MTSFDQLWNYADPAGTEQKFREALQQIAPEEERDTYLQLQTQIARTYSLRGMFAEAHHILDEVAPQLPEGLTVAHVRYHLERGRTCHSAANQKEALEHFEKARQQSALLNNDFYVIDALHMLAIASPPKLAVALNEAALRIAENTQDAAAQKWLGPLYNNLGWAFFDAGRYEQALNIFLRALQWRQAQPGAPEIFMAKWCVARTLRALNRTEDALTIQLALLEEMIEKDTPDGYVYEELAELHLLKGEELHKMYFQFAWTELSKDPWLAQQEPERLARMKRLAE